MNIFCVLQTHYTEKESMSQPGDISEEADESQCCSLKLLAEEEGYEADSESNPDSETKDGGKCELSEYAKQYLTWPSLVVFLRNMKIG